MRKTKLAASLLAVSLAATTLLTGCNNDPASSGSNSGSTPGTSNSGSESSGTVETPALELTFTGGTELRMATGYNNPKTGLFFDAETAAGDDGITLADGKHYKTGDLKPTWVEVQNKLNVKFTDKYQGNGAQAEFNAYKDHLEEVDMVSGTVVLLSEYGKSGKIVNIANYLDAMPNFKAYLEANPIVRLSVTGSVTNDASKGAIYFSPYFDGVNDIEKMPLMRTDWVEKLLNGEGKFEAAASGTTATPVYKPYMPTTGTVSVTVVKKDGSGTEEITKDYSKYGNIIEKMNASMSGVEAVNMLREYIDATYGGYYGTNRADLFIGQNAAWDADELVALLRCVCANAQTLNGTDNINGLFARNDDNHSRRADLVRFAGVLFGARGLESRQDYLYIGKDGKLVDARTQDATYEAVERMNAIAQEGLISKDYMATQGGDVKAYLQNDSGFMEYDYNQTQTVYNETQLQEGEKFMAVMIPVAKWDDGDSSTPDYMRFTESWRSVKTDGWGISMAGVGLTEDKKVTTQAEIDALPDKLKACLKLIDYAYSPEGQVLMSYGPEAFRSTKTFNFNGEEWPEIAEATRKELWEKASGNYTNYARFYLGSTLSFAKSQAFEYQCTHEVGKEGAGYISKAIALGTIKHPMLSIESNPWWTSVPTVLPLDEADSAQINSFKELAADKWSTANNNKAGANVLVSVVVGGYTGDVVPGTNRAEVINKVKTDWNADAALALREKAWQRLVKFYEDLNA